ncbi:MAG: hypothetical protein P8P36_10300, partial [Akkermansiaceae bacterium]|nr:hypothetical protein [Akkermansiaceae bacterium]
VFFEGFWVWLVLLFCVYSRSSLAEPMIRFMVWSLANRVVAQQVERAKRMAIRIESNETKA